MSMGALSSAKVIDISINKLTGTTPASMFGMSNLAAFYLTSNYLTGDYPDIVLEPSTEQISLTDNQFRHLWD